MTDPPPAKRKVLTAEQQRLWKHEVFSWGFARGWELGRPLLQIFEVPHLSVTYAEGYYVAYILKFLLSNEALIANVLVSVPKEEDT